MKIQKRHNLNKILLTIAMMLTSLLASAQVYVDPLDGDDLNNGTTNPIKTISRAKELIKEQLNANPSSKPYVIIRNNPFVIEEDTEWDGTIVGHPQWCLHVQRVHGVSPFWGSIVEVNPGKELTLTNIVLDGVGSGNGSHTSSPHYIYDGAALVFLHQNATLIINEGAILQRSHRFTNGHYGEAGGAQTDPSSIPGTKAFYGGAVESEYAAHVEMNGGRITDCWVSGRGGGIYLGSKGVTADANASTFIMNGGEIDHCQAFETLKSEHSGKNYSGGGVWVEGLIDGPYYATVELHGGKIHDCKAAIDETTFTYGRGRGAGIVCSVAKVTMDSDDMEIYNNHAKRYGGGIQVQDGSIFNFSAGKIYENIVGMTNHSETESPYNGVNSGAAGLSVAYSIDDDHPTVLNMTGGMIYNNHASIGNGAAIHTSNNTELHIKGGKIFNNDAKYGGAINLERCQHFEFDSDCTVEIYNNTAKNGGAIASDGGILIVRGGFFHDNHAIASGSGGTDTYGLGGAFYIHTDVPYGTHVSNFSMYGGSIYANEASADGGAIYVRQPRATGYTSQKSPVLVQGGSLYDNTAGGNGGALYVNYGDLTVTGSDLINNTAGTAGGAIYFDANSTMTVGTGAMNIKDNIAGGVPNNVYLVNGNHVDIASDATFNPQYFGVYTENRTPDIPVFMVETGHETQLGDIYRDMKNGTMNVYDDSQVFSPKYTADQTTLYFGNASPWSPLQQQVRKATDLVDNDGDGYYDIGNVRQLTAFLWYVNGITTHDVNFASAEPGAQGELTADIDMEGHYWVPIGKSSAGYTGIFDGNGYTISHLTMTPTNTTEPSEGRGMFGLNQSGTIKNVILKDCYFGSKAASGTPTPSTNYLGCIVSNNNGTVGNNVADGTLHATDSYCIMGGIAGKNSGTVHSSFASPSMEGYQMGGLVGQNVTSGNLFNSFANASFNYKGESKYCGGLVGVNSGTIENCYVRLQGSAPASNFGYLVGSNKISEYNGNLNYCYALSSAYTAGETGNQTGLGTYGATSTPYLYNHRDNQVDVTVGTNSFVSSTTGADKQMLIALNNWVTAENAKETPRAECTYWLRTTTKAINDDLPILRLPATNAVAAENGSASLDYNQVNDLLTAYTTADKAVCLYGQEGAMAGNSGSAAPLYIDQEATLIPATPSTVINGYTSQMINKYASSRWHDFSSPLQQSDIGFTYHNSEPAPFDWTEINPCSVTIASDDAHSLFPSDLLSKTTFASVDLYCFYEPEYHWLNLKRNTDSHWHMNATTEPISYVGNGIGASTNGNEAYLVPGKGYLVSIDVDQLLQNYGTLNNGEVTLNSVTKTDDNAWAERLGFNLLGNPYQSYLDFEQFMDASIGSGTNAGNLWTGSSEYNRTYATFDPKQNSYVQYKSGTSVDANTASQYIHPHQGFFIRMTEGTNSSTTVKYTNDMRSLRGNDKSNFRGGEQPAYPLINFLVRDSEGNADIAVLELDRTEDDGATKMRMNECKGMISLGYRNDDFGILFRTKVEDYQPLRFEAIEAGTFTLTWNTANADFDKLTLIDNIAGTTTDMLGRDSYSFEAMPDQYASRFKVVFGDYKGIDEFGENGPSTGSETCNFAFQMGDQLVVNGEGDLQIVDMLGRVVLTDQLTGSQGTTSLPMTPGVYVLRLTNANGTRTQKMVIR